MRMGSGPGNRQDKMYRQYYSSKLKEAPIFVVDDEPINLKLIERILSAEGYRNLTTIQDPRAVAAHYRARRPHLILMDINMPGLDGYAVLEELKQADAGGFPPIVFLTAQDAAEHKVRAFDSGALDFISKPFNRLELLSRVRNLLELEAAHQALSDKNHFLEAIVEQRTQALRETQLEVVQKLGRAAEYRDNETGAHILRMSNVSALLAKHLGFSREETENLLHASPMHDVGKIAIPDHILLKPGKFNAEEWEIMKTHTTLGYQILSGQNSALLNLAGEIALSHHEKWDGSGYPEGLEGENIPISCRIVAVADVFDALVSDRPYKRAWSIRDACDHINAQSGCHFDPKVVKVFNQVFRDILEIRDRYRDPVPDYRDHARHSLVLSGIGV